MLSEDKKVRMGSTNLTPITTKIKMDFVIALIIASSTIRGHENLGLFFYKKSGRIACVIVAFKIS